MKHFDILINALQDVIVETFNMKEGNINLSRIREIAQRSLHDYKEKTPKPEFLCPNNYTVGADYHRFEDCLTCPLKYSQLCGIYNYVWYR